MGEHRTYSSWCSTQRNVTDTRHAHKYRMRLVSERARPSMECLRTAWFVGGKPPCVVPDLACVARRALDEPTHLHSPTSWRPLPDHTRRNDAAVLCGDAHPPPQTGNSSLCTHTHTSWCVARVCHPPPQHPTLAPGMHLLGGRALCTPAHQNAIRHTHTWRHRPRRGPRCRPSW